MSKSEIGIIRQELVKMSHKITEFESIVANMAAKIAQLISENREKDAKIATLEAALRSYENPHTPPSKSRPKRTQREVQERDINQVQRPSGSRQNHTGHSTKRKADRTQEHTADCCDDSGSKITRNGTKSKIVTDIMIVTENVNHLTGSYHCDDCGKNFDAANGLVRGTDLWPQPALICICTRI